MKRGTIRHPKVLALASALGVHHAQAIGHLTALWEFCGEFSKPGDIGRYPNSAIARGALWDGDPEVFVRALVATRWVDEHIEHRLLVHHWAAHCEYSVSKFLLENKMRFADGSKPRAGVKSQASKQVRVATARKNSQPVAPTVAVAVAVQEPLPGPEACTRRAGPQRNGSQRASLKEKVPELRALEDAIFRVALFNIHDDGVLGNLQFLEIARLVVEEAAGDLYSKRGYRQLDGIGLDAIRCEAWKRIIGEVGNIERKNNRRELLIARAVEVAAEAGLHLRTTAGGHEGRLAVNG